MDAIFGSALIMILGAIGLGIVVIAVMISKFLRKVEPGKALIIIKPLANKVAVSFSGGIVIPLLHRAEEMDISTKKLTVNRSGSDGLICKDNIRADISVSFYVRVNNTVMDVQQVAQSIGVDRASALETLDALFQAKFSEALKTVGKQMDFEELFEDRTNFKEQIMKTIGQHLNGYSLEDTAIDYLEQTPLDKLDQFNIMDAEGIRKITEITLEKREIKEKRETEATERILLLEQQREEAKAKQKSEIAIIQSREQAEADKVGEEQRLKSETARIKTNEELAIAEENAQRQVEVATKNKERTVAVETERVEKDRQLEITEREKLVTLADIGKEREVEQERKTIQEIIRQRVALERTVAEEQERTADVRAFADADRSKRVTLTKAEAEAEQNLVLEIKMAEAKQKAALHNAEEREIHAQAELSTASKFSDAKKTLAEGIIAEESARGLANVKVKEADAEAIKKVGEAEAQAYEFRVKAEAEGELQKGQANAEVKKVDALAMHEVASAEAEILRKKFEAEADGIAAKGDAEAQAINNKAEAMKGFDEVGRDHEEYKLRLGLQEKLAIENIVARKEIAGRNAEVLGTALKTAKIDIVGGESVFFDKLVNAIGNGKSVDAYFREENGVLNEVKDNLMGDDGEGGGSLIRRLREVVATTGVSTDDVKNLTVSALIAKMMDATDDRGILAEIGSISRMAKRHGMDKVKAATLWPSSAA